MDPRLLKYYNRELQHAREMGAEFATEFPKIAGRLGMENEKVADPYVERLLEGFAFLAARVHLKIDSEFPTFTQHMLEMVYPHFLSPLPAMAIAQFNPVLEESALAEGFRLPANTALHGTKARGQQTACEFRTGDDTTLWPIEVTEAKYFSSAGALATANVPKTREVRAGIRLRLRATAGIAFDELSLDRLRFYLKGKDGNASRIYEQLLGNCESVIVRPKGGARQWHRVLSGNSIRAVGFNSQESLIPYIQRSFDGYRILQEYFGFPERFLFVDFCELEEAIAATSGTELEIIILLNRRNQEIEGILEAKNFALNCVPVINLFPRRADRIHLKDRDHEYHLVPDRTRPMDYEVWSINDIQGFGSTASPERSFEPLYAHHDATSATDRAYFTTRRMPRALSSKQRQKGARSSYVGSEVYISLVDTANAPLPSSIRQVEAKTLCTNRDLPLHMPTGQGQSDFTLDTGAPVESIKCVAGPTRPKPSFAHGDVAWRLVSHLSLNYLSLVDEDGDEGASAMRSLLSLYSDENDIAMSRQIDGLKSISSRPIYGRIPTDGPITFGRGLEITLTCEENAFEGTGVFLFGQVMEEFLAKYVSLNSFTETVLRSTERGEIMRWPPRLGQRQVM